MDVLRDTSFSTWYKIGRHILGADAIPAYVREYTPHTPETASALSDEDFADPGKRAFPLDSAASTWLSAAYLAYNNPTIQLEKVALFGRKKETSEEVEANRQTALWLREHGIEGKHTWKYLDKPEREAAKNAMVTDFTIHQVMKAANAWGILEDVEQVMRDIQTWRGETKQAAADDESSYGWIIKDAEGNAIARRYPMYDAEGVKLAATYFDENRKHYPWDIRQGIAQRIVEKAAEYAVKESAIPQSVLREAGKGVPRRTVLMRELNERARLAKDAEAGVLLANMNRVLATASSEELAQSLDKIASALNHFDEAEGLTRYYGTRLTYPSDFLAGVSYKEAADFQANSVQLRRYVFDATKLATQLDADMLAGTLGNDFVFKVAAEIPGEFANKEQGCHFENAKLDPTKLAAAMRQLPQEDKGALEDMIVACCDG